MFHLLIFLVRTKQPLAKPKRRVVRRKTSPVPLVGEVVGVVVGVVGGGEVVGGVVGVVGLAAGSNLIIQASTLFSSCERL